MGHFNSIHFLEEDIGRTYNNLKFLGEMPNEKSPSGLSIRIGLFFCLICNNTREMPLSFFRINQVASCGCLSNKRKFKDNLPAKRLSSIKNTYKGHLVRATKTIKWLLTDEQTLNLIEDNCNYCGCPPSNTGSYKSKQLGFYKYSGIDRIDSGGNYVLGNVVSCCKICNIAKNSLTLDEFTQWIERAYLHQQNSQLSYC